MVDLRSLPESLVRVLVAPLLMYQEGSLAIFWKWATEKGAWRVYDAVGEALLGPKKLWEPKELQLAIG